MSAGTDVTATPPDREALRSLLGDELLRALAERWGGVGYDG